MPSRFATTLSYHVISWYGGFRSHRGTPKSSILDWDFGFSMKWWTIQRAWGTPMVQETFIFAATWPRKGPRKDIIDCACTCVCSIYIYTI
jgi:hypothetical protein